MTTTCRRLGSAIVVTALALATILVSAGIISAQCASVTVTNQTGCSINLCLYDASTGQVACQLIAAGGIGVPFALPASFTISGVKTPANNFYPFATQPPSPACLPCILMSPTLDTCCAKICFDLPTCRIRIQPCAHPCPL